MTVASRILRAKAALQKLTLELEAAMDEARDSGFTNMADELEDIGADIHGYGELERRLKTLHNAALKMRLQARGGEPMTAPTLKGESRNLQEARHSFNLGFVGDGKTGAGPQISGFGRDVPILMSLAEVYETEEPEEIEESDCPEEEEKTEGA
jgi:hypothetical protein